MGLERRLVGAEAGVAPRAEHRHLRRGDEVGGHARRSRWPAVRSSPPSARARARRTRRGARGTTPGGCCASGHGGTAACDPRTRARRACRDRTPPPMLLGRPVGPAGSCHPTRRLEAAACTSARAAPWSRNRGPLHSMSPVGPQHDATASAHRRPHRDSRARRGPERSSCAPRRSRATPRPPPARRPGGDTRRGRANRQRPVAEVPATPWVGAPGHVRTTAQIMAGARRTTGRPSVDVAADGRLRPRSDRPSVAQRDAPVARPERREPDTNAAAPRYLRRRRPDASTCWPSTAASAPCQGDRRRRRRARTPPPTSSSPAVRDGAATAKPRVRYDRKAGRWIVTMITRALPNRYPGGGEQHRHGHRRPPTGASSSGPTPARTAASAAGPRAWATTRPSASTTTAYYIGVNQRCGAALADGELRFDLGLRGAPQRAADRRHAGRVAVRRTGGHAGRRGHLHAAGRRQLRRQPDLWLRHRRRQRREGPARAPPHQQRRRLADALVRSSSSRRRSIPPAIRSRARSPGRHAAARRSRRPAVAGGDPQRPAVDLAPLRGEQPRRGRAWPAAATASAGTSSPT